MTSAREKLEGGAGVEPAATLHLSVPFQVKCSGCFRLPVVVNNAAGRGWWRLGYGGEGDDFFSAKSQGEFSVCMFK